MDYAHCMDFPPVYGTYVHTSTPGCAWHVLLDLVLARLACAWHELLTLVLARLACAWHELLELVLARLACTCRE